MSPCHCVSKISHLETLTSIFALESIYTRWALKSFPAHHSSWARRTLRTLREDATDSEGFTPKLKLKPSRKETINSLVVLCYQMLPLPLIFLSDPEKDVFQLHDRKFKPIITITRALSSQRECSYFMSLLDHLWILSALVVLLDQEVPNTIDTVYLNDTGLSVIINLNFRHNLILTGVPGAPASPLFPSTPFGP